MFGASANCLPRKRYESQPTFWNVSNRAVALFVLLYSFTQSLSGTSVVIVRTPQRVVIAADSLGKLNGKSVNMCKIVTHPRFSTVFAMAGIATTSRRFSAFDLAKSAIAINYGKMRATVEWFESKATIRIKTEMQRMRKEDPSEYKQALNRPEPFQIAFIGWDENIPTFTTIAFSLQESAGKVRVAYKESRCPGEGCPSGFTVTPLGANEAIVTALRSPRLLDYDLNAMAVRLVKLEITAKPDIVGPPISDLAIDSNGTHWGNKGECH